MSVSRETSVIDMFYSPGQKRGADGRWSGGGSTRDYYSTDGFTPEQLDAHAAGFSVFGPGPSVQFKRRIAAADLRLRSEHPNVTPTVSLSPYREGEPLGETLLYNTGAIELNVRYGELPTSAPEGHYVAYDRTFVHEFGHAHAYSTNTAAERIDMVADAVVERTGVERTGFAVSKALREGISAYAGTSPEEAIAEAFTDVHVNGSGASHLSKAIMSKMGVGATLFYDASQPRDGRGRWSRSSGGWGAADPAQSSAALGMATTLARKYPGVKIQSITYLGIESPVADSGAVAYMDRQSGTRIEFFASAWQDVPAPPEFEPGSSVPFARGTSMAYVMAHEWGHAAAASASGFSNGDFAWGVALNKAVNKHRREVGDKPGLLESFNGLDYVRDNLSTYAGADPHEAYAEAFADVEHNGAAAAPVSKALHADLIHRLEQVSGTGAVSRETHLAFNPGQPRASDGKWTAGGVTTKATDRHKAQTERALRAGSVWADPQVRAKAEETLQKRVDEGELSIRVNAEVLDAIADDGVYRTQHEEGIRPSSPRVAYSPTERTKGEAAMFDGLKTPPIYGYIADPERDAKNTNLNRYGDSRIILKDSVRDRTTITVADSLGGYVRPSAARDVSFESLPVDEIKLSTAGKKDPGGKGIEVFLNGWQRTSYIEAQIHGGVKVSDIARIETAQDNPVRVRELLAAYPGVEIGHIGIPGPAKRFGEVITLSETDMFFDPGQPRDAGGRWAKVGGSGKVALDAKGRSVRQYSVWGKDVSMRRMLDEVAMVERMSLDDKAAAQKDIAAEFEAATGAVVEKVTIVSKADKWTAAGTVKIRGKVLDAAGETAGFFDRRITSESGKLVAHHDLLSIYDDKQGQGIGSKFIKASDEYYRKVGVDEIRLTANVDVGGYAWAKQGFDFVDPSAAGGVIMKLADYNTDDAAYQGQVQKLADRANEAISSGNRALWPSAFEVSRAGYKPGATIWPGKGAMLGSNWEGVKRLDYATTDLFFDPSQPRGADGRWTSGGGTPMARHRTAAAPLGVKYNDPTYPDAVARRLEAVKVASTELLAEVTTGMAGYGAPGVEAQLAFSGLKKDGYTFAVNLVRDGEVIGNANRSIIGTTVRHEDFGMYGDAQGQGIGSAFLKASEDAYVARGLDRIEVEANVDVGGYAWARMGFDFTSPDEGMIMDYVDQLAQHKTNDPVYQSEVAELAEAAVGSPLSAFEISQFGRTPGATSWPGKSVMLGSSWSGEKYLSADVPRGTEMFYDPGQPRAADGKWTKVGRGRLGDLLRRAHLRGVRRRQRRGHGRPLPQGRARGHLPRRGQVRPRRGDRRGALGRQRGDRPLVAAVLRRLRRGRAGRGGVAVRRHDRGILRLPVHHGRGPAGLGNPPVRRRLRACRQALGAEPARGQGPGRRGRRQGPHEKHRDDGTLRRGLHGRQREDRRAGLRRNAGAPRRAVRRGAAGPTAAGRRGGGSGHGVPGAETGRRAPRGPPHRHGGLVPHQRQHQGLDRVRLREDHHGDRGCQGADDAQRGAPDHARRGPALRGRRGALQDRRGRHRKSEGEDEMTSARKWLGQRGTPQLNFPEARRAATATDMFYDPSQPRAKDGKWTKGSGSGRKAYAPPTGPDPRAGQPVPDRGGFLYDGLGHEVAAFTMYDGTERTLASILADAEDEAVGITAEDARDVADHFASMYQESVYDTSAVASMAYYDADTKEAVYQSDEEGTYYDPGSIVLTGRLTRYDEDMGDSEDIGQFTRAFANNGDKVWVKHALLTINEDAQGQGLGSEFLRTSEAFYKDVGVDLVMLDANIDVGGYAWARAGFDFNLPDEARPVLQHGINKLERDGVEVPEQLRTMLAAAEKYDYAGTAERAALPTPPTAFEISNIGHTPGATTWPGKALMLGSSWSGSKTLTRRWSPSTSPSPGPRPRWPSLFHVKHRPSTCSTARPSRGTRGAAGPRPGPRNARPPTSRAATPRRSRTAKWSSRTTSTRKRSASRRCAPPRSRAAWSGCPTRSATRSRWTRRSRCSRACPTTTRRSSRPPPRPWPGTSSGTPAPRT